MFTTTGEIGAVTEKTGSLRRVAINYPSILPPASWLRRSLLLFDACACIVDPGFWKRVDPGLTWLIENGHFEPLTPDSLSSASIDTIVREFESAVALLPRSAFDAPKNERIYLGKLPEEILAELARHGLADRRERSFWVTPAVQQLVLASIGQQMAMVRSSFEYGQPAIYSLHTDNIDLEQWLFGSIPGRKSLDARELLISGLLPTPSEDHSYEDIIAFRNEHSDALYGQWAVIEAILKPDSDVYDVAAAQNRIELAIASLKRDNRYRKWIATAGGAIVAITGVGLSGRVGHWLDPSEVQWIFDGVGTSASVAVASRMIRKPMDPAADRPYSYRYVSAARNEFG
jgi:hypothetical protein